MGRTAQDRHAVVERITDFARGFIGGRRVVAVGFPVAAATPHVNTLRKLGSDRCFIVAPHIGTGPLPDPDDAEWVSLGIEAPDVVTEFRRLESAVHDPPYELLIALDRFDPDRTALVVTAPFLPISSVAGRPVVGGRRPQWVALEDKSTNDELFDRAGVDRPPCTVVPARDLDGLRTTSRRMDRGAGTVWAGDARDGFNGGGIYVRWVVNDDHAVTAHRFFESRCDRVRVAPFLDGLPVSIHGFVTDEGIAVFRPTEMVTLRSTDPPALCYAGAATFYDPPEGDRSAMRAAAIKVGELLRAEVGFLGSFGVDGVVTADGFLPTELNPRFGAGLATIVRGLGEFPLLPMHWGTIAGMPLPVSPAELEDTVLASADAHRFGGGWLSVSTRWGETRKHPVVLIDDGCRGAEKGEDPDGIVITGPGSEGGFIRFTAAPDRTPIGPSIAPRVVAAFGWADRHLDSNIGPLVPAPDVRGGEGRGSRRRATTPAPEAPAGQPPAGGPSHPPERMVAGDGIVLCRARPSDAPEIASAVEQSLDHLRPWMPWAATSAPTEVETQRERLRACDRAWSDGSAYDYLIRAGDEGLVVGGGSLMRRVGEGGIEIGYWVHVDHVRRGYATAAARTLTEAAWGLPGVARVEIHCDEANLASREVPARLGYRLDRTEADPVEAPGEIGRSMIWLKDRPATRGAR